MNDIETLVQVEISDRLNEMSGLKATDEAYKAYADVTMKFIDRATKMRELEIQSKANELKEKELAESRKKRVWDFGKEVIKTVVPPTIAIVGAIGLTNYERNDSTVSTATREFWKQVFRLKN